MNPRKKKNTGESLYLVVSYMICAIVWFPILDHFGYTGTASFAEVVQRPRYKAEDSLVRRAYERRNHRSNDEVKRKATSDWMPDYNKVRVNRALNGEWKQKDYWANGGLKITDQDW